MNAEIISIGTEILIGSITNTNSRYLSEKLALNGIDVFRHTTVGDNLRRLIQVFEEASSRADILITSGGLGPTEDDITTLAASQFLGKKLALHEPTREAISLKLKKLGKKISPLIEKQCWLPSDSIIFQNDNGTAPAFLSPVIRNQKKVWLLCLPGPPRELQPLFEQKTLPYLIKRLELKHQTFQIRTLKIYGTESSVAEKVGDLLKLKPPVTLGIYAKPGLVELKIMSKDVSTKKTTTHVTRLEKVIRQRLGSNVYGVDNQTMADALGTLMTKNHLSLSVAESCTGGLLGHEITQFSGASKFFKGSVVAYANEVKENLLGVSKKTLSAHGAVSEAVARSMAENVRLKFGTDYGIAITGIAGPGGATKTKPVGLVYIAISSTRGTQVTKNLFMGSRTEIKQRAALKAMDLLRLLLTKNPPLE